MTRPYTTGHITGDELKDNCALLSVVAGLLGTRTDAALADALGVMPPIISKIRHGFLGVGPTVQLRMLECGISLFLIREYVPSKLRNETPK